MLIIALRRIKVMNAFLSSGSRAPRPLAAAYPRSLHLIPHLAELFIFCLLVSFVSAPIRFGEVANNTRNFH